MEIFCLNEKNKENNSFERINLKKLNNFHFAYSLDLVKKKTTQKTKELISIKKCSYPFFFFWQR